MLVSGTGLAPETVLESKIYDSQIVFGDNVEIRQKYYNELVNIPV